MPTLFNVPTLSILAPTLLDFGTEEQKERHIPAILRGEELWVQFLSEPSGGSDLAGLVTQATRDGDVFILNGSKIWSSGAYRSDYAMCLARTDPHVPKHQGLTMFIVKIHQPGIEVQPISMVNGLAEFCQEFFDDVAIPAENVIGAGQRRMDGGLTAPLPRAGRRGRGIALRQRCGHGPRRRGRTASRTWSTWPGPPARPTIRVVRQLVAEARVNDRVQAQLTERVTLGIRTGALPAPAGSLSRLFAATNGERRHDIGLEIAGSGAGAWVEGDPAGAWGALLPDASGRQPGRRQHRDAAQHHQRTGAGHAPRVRRRPRPTLRRGTPQLVTTEVPVGPMSCGPADRAAGRATAQAASSFMSRLRLPPMILATSASGRPLSSSTKLSGSDMPSGWG